MVEFTMSAFAELLMSKISPAVFAAPPAVSVPEFAEVPNVRLCAVDGSNTPPIAPKRSVPAEVLIVATVVVFWRSELIVVVAAPSEMFPPPPALFKRTFEVELSATVLPLAAMSV
jgi:hypothetical protein